MTFPASAPALADATDDGVETIELDLRRLPAPEPMVRILEALAELGDGQALLARTPCHPRPLLDRLAGMGFRAEGVVEASGEAWVHLVADDGATGA
jgi:uncharacterized protein (DUF2249 family)